MFATRQANLPATRSVREHTTFGIAALAVFLASALVLAALASTLGRDSQEHAAAVPATLTQHVGTLSYVNGTDAGTYRQPADVVVLDGLLYVLDTGNDRILVQDQGGTVRSVIGPSVDGRPALRGPMALATDGRLLYVANAGASGILVLEPDGHVVKTLDLGQAPSTGLAPRPIGLAVDPEGGLLVSDADGNRVLHYDRDGQLQQMIGSGSRGSGSDGFSAPGGVAFDTAGYMYVVDILNGRVVRLAPDGSFVRQFGRPGDTAGTLSRPKDVAVDGAGNVYVSDGLLAAIQVFNADGGYLGFIGRSDPGDPHSRSLFVAPAGLTIAGDTLYAMDRFAGLFAFQLPYQPSPSP